MKRKLMSLLLCAVMTTGLFATQTVWADEETETADEDIDFSEDPYEVNMVITLPAASPSQSEIDRVVEHVNEITKKKLNMTLNLQLLPYSTYLEQIPLELSSGSDIDILTAITGYAQGWVSSGYLLDMTDLLDEYGQEAIATYSSPDLAKAAQLNGKIFGLPVHKEIAQQPTIFFRTDILDKYDIDVSNVKTMADVDAIYEQVAEKEPGMWMLAADNLGVGKAVVFDMSVGGTSFAGLMDFANNTTVTNLLASPEFKEWCEYNHKWFDNGWINSGAASDTESYYSYIASGQAFSFFSDMDILFQRLTRKTTAVA